MAVAVRWVMVPRWIHGLFEPELLSLKFDRDTGLLGSPKAVTSPLVSKDPGAAISLLVDCEWVWTARSGA